MSDLWREFVLQLQDTSKTANDLYESLLHINSWEPEIIERAIVSARKLRPDIAEEAISLYRFTLAVQDSTKEIQELAKMLRNIGDNLGTEKFHEAMKIMESHCSEDRSTAVVLAAGRIF